MSKKSKRREKSLSNIVELSTWHFVMHSSADDLCQQEESYGGRSSAAASSPSLCAVRSAKKCIAICFTRHCAPESAAQRSKASQLFFSPSVCHCSSSYVHTRYTSPFPLPNSQRAAQTFILHLYYLSFPPPEKTQSA